MNEMIKKAFVSRILASEKDRFKGSQSRAIQRMLNFRSGRLENDRTYETSTDGSMDGKLTLTLPAYGRFLDIKPKNRKISENGRKFRKLKAFPIYNRYAFGHYYAIADQLMYGLTEAVRATIKDELKDVTVKL
jgi:hypothetical protein